MKTNDKLEILRTAQEILLSGIDQIIKTLQDLTQRIEKLENDAAQRTDRPH